MSQADAIDLIPIEIAGTILGLDTRWVRVCEGSYDITPVPGAPPFVAGIVCVEGSVVAVVAFEMLLGLQLEPDLQEQHFLILVRRGQVEFAFGAHSVGRSRLVTSEELRSPGYDSDWVLGETVDGLTVLDLPTILTDTSLFEMPDPDAFNPNWDDTSELDALGDLDDDDDSAPLDDDDDADAPDAPAPTTADTDPSREDTP